MTVPRAVMRAFVRAVVRPTLNPRLPVGRQRRRLDLFGKVAVLPRGIRRDVLVLGSRPVDRFTPPGADRTRAVLFLHGGGYTVGSAATHAALAAHLAVAAGAAVYLPDYRLAPEHRHPAALEDALATYDALRATGVSVSIAGDSAGGGLALALALCARDTDRPLPSALALISPWVDLTLTNVSDDRRDPMLTTAWLRGCAAQYAGLDVTRPEVSPLHADFIGLPPLLVHGGSEEILLPDIERLVARVRAAGVPVRYRRLNRMWHVAHLHAGLVKAATGAVAEVGAFLSETRENSHV